MRDAHARAHSTGQTVIASRAQAGRCRRREPREPPSPWHERRGRASGACACCSRTANGLVREHLRVEVDDGAADLVKGQAQPREDDREVVGPLRVEERDAREAGGARCGLAAHVRRVPRLTEGRIDTHGENARGPPAPSTERTSGPFNGQTQPPAEPRTKPERRSTTRDHRERDRHGGAS